MYSRYLDYSEPAIRAHNLAVVQNEQKDALISTLKTDLYELRQLEGDYLRLNDQITALEDKHSLLLEEKERSEREQRSKSEIDKNSIIELRAQIDNLRINIQRISVEIEEALRENTALKRMSDARANEIQVIINDNRDLEGKNERQNDENRNLSLNIKALKEERKKLEDDCDALNNLLDENVNKLKALERAARNSESNNARLDKTLLQAQNDNAKLVAELKQKQDEVRRAETKLKDISSTVDELKIQFNSLETQTNKNKSQSINNNAGWQNEVAKGKELLAKLNNVQSTIRSREDELEGLSREEDKLRNEHFQRLDQNKLLNGEIDRLLSLIAEYEQVNKQLIEEIQIYIDQDEQAREILNRKENMRQLIERTLAKVQSTNQHIKHLKYC